MSTPDWVTDEQRAAGPCPSCGAAAAMPVLYGYPDAGTYYRLEGVVEFAGCLVPPDPARWRCGRCGASWGRAVGFDDGPAESTFAGLDDD